MCGSMIMESVNHIYAYTIMSGEEKLVKYVKLLYLQRLTKFVVVFLLSKFAFLSSLALMALHRNPCMWKL